ncbi:hypothetical protein B0O99DRAFT_689071 [Bisporella sp. PMI_857]|nr:hypothetical protein B0O99DRAFT_689071 [Bisporella sp. PMI_857]
MSLANRICNSFHAIELHEANSFPSSTDMRTSLWKAIRMMWPACLQDDSISCMDAIVDADSEDNTTDQVIWKAYSHPWFSRFLEVLADPHLVGRTTMSISSHRIPFEHLIRHKQLGGRGCATRVRLEKDSKEFHVFKGIDFRTFLAQNDDEGDSAIKYTVRSWHNSNMMLITMRPHPNVLPPP